MSTRVNVSNVRPIVERRPPSDDDVLDIAFVNNMPKAAFESTDRQFSTRLAGAANGPRVRLSRYAMDDEASKKAGYQPLREIWRAKVDALVVTGSEPRQPRLVDEDYWPLLRDLIHWTRDNALSSIWSCLAAHAAALELDGIERRLIGFKRSGVFPCDIVEPHRLVQGWSGAIHVPHSRLNELTEADLVAHGYRILTRSPEAGPDVILRPGRGALVLLQGHPEYDLGSLLFEYRRDMKRWFAGASTFTPNPPQNYFGPAVRVALEDAARIHDEARLEEILRDFKTGRRPVWSGWATTLYGNWLTYVARLKAQRRLRIHETAPTVHPI